MLEFENLNLQDIVTPIDPVKLRTLLVESNYDKDETEELCTGFEKGFDIGYHGPRQRKDYAHNIPITVGSKLDMWNKIMKEVELGHCAGPFSTIPYKYYVQSPIGLVPKKGNKTRLIFHLSYCFGESENQWSITHHTPDEFCHVRYNDLDCAVRNCLKLIPTDMLFNNNSKLTIFYSKSNLMSAFRIVPILPSQRYLMCMYACHPITNQIRFFVDKNLAFGASISYARFQQFSNALTHITEYFLQRKSCCTNYLDDFIFYSLYEQVCNHMMQTFLNVCSMIGCPVSMEKTEWAADVFLGVLLNGKSWYLAIPDDKKWKAMHLINWVCQNRKITISMVQKLTGTLNFLTKVIVPSRTFTRRMYDKLKLVDNQGRLLKQYHHISVDQEFQKDCKMWKIFFDLTTSNPLMLCRPFIDFDDVEQHAKILNFYSDASLNENFGMGAIFDEKWIYGVWGSQFIRDQKPSIEFLELAALFLGLATWQHDPNLSNTAFVIYCDNTSVRDMINGMSSHCPQCMKFIRLIALSNIKYNRQVIVRYVKSKDNVLADALSRLEFDRFWMNAPESMNQIPDCIPSQYWPITKVWFNDEL